MLVFHLYNTLVILPFPHSAILYLNDNFSGGELFFTNRDAKTVTVSHFFQPKVTSVYHLIISFFFPPLSCLKAKVKPSCGRLVGFSSGPVNPHGVTAVTSGRRCALALWFTKEKLYRDMVRAVTHRHTAPTSVLQPCGGSCCGARVR